ncbi:MAG: DUF4339 domain-containing protein [Betaproteobacteria bacterium]|nr:DUF4339 domain-containing protein [Betaproteobacteria bacterium]
MSEFVFFELKPEMRRELKLPPHPIPVRRGRQQVVFAPGGRVDIAAMLVELRSFLDDNPALEGDYRQLLAMLAYLSGLAAAARGFHEQALQLYEMGLDAVPESVSLRSHAALALHCLGRNVEARREIETVIARTPKDQILPVLWLILARICARDGELQKAYALLKDVSTLIPGEDGFWDFLGELEDRLGITRTPAHAVEPEDPAFTVVMKPAQHAPARPVAAAPAVPPPLPPSTPSWHYAVNGQALGPVPEAELRVRLARGELPADTPVWNPALDDWKAASAAGLIVA